MSRFLVTWDDPADAELSWEWDDMHMPFPLAPLAADYVLAIAGGFDYRYLKLRLPLRIRGRIWHGYAYFAEVLDVPEHQRARFGQRIKSARRQAARRARRYWDGHVMPGLRECYATIASVAVESLSPAELAESWQAAWAATDRAWQFHFAAISGVYAVLDELADRYEAIVPGASPGEALRLVQGAPTEIQAVERELHALAEMARRHPAVTDWLRAEPAGGDEAPEADFAAALAAFLERHGHLGQPFDDLTLPSWGEQPALLRAELRKRLDQPAEDPEARRLRLRREADELAAALLARLPEGDERRAPFESTLALARDIGPLSEGHNYWIDRMAQARLRALCMRVGHRLVRAGVIEHAEDIFYLHRSEVPELLLAPADRRALVGERRAEHDRQRSIQPPRFLGKPPDDGPAGRFDQPRPEQPVADRLTGIGASAGVARGPARVVLSPADFGRVQPGDVIVCPSSNPSWVPLFAIAAGLVTNTGGVLSHAAVVAREFGLPAVVGTGEATRRIADDRLVELDGATGEVRLL
ncbi:MAG TPA: PEP-utilizing enzyme [Candidatus Limnocylindrales bacterium]|nr:PEP-utilizing enzyme [Candidatus Limnocylindrales bacterium]